MSVDNEMQTCKVYDYWGRKYEHQKEVYMYMCMKNEINDNNWNMWWCKGYMNYYDTSNKYGVYTNNRWERTRIVGRVKNMNGTADGIIENDGPYHKPSAIRVPRPFVRCRKEIITYRSVVFTDFKIKFCNNKWTTPEVVIQYTFCEIAYFSAERDSRASVLVQSCFNHRATSAKQP